MLPTWTETLLLLAAALSVGGLAVVVVHRARRRRVLGAPIAARRAPRRVRWATALLFLLGLALAATQPLSIAGPAAALILAALATWLASPAPEDGACGQSGVATGWDLAPWDALVEWRLTGDHLRWRTGPEWRAVALPRAEHERVRARLAACCPQAESRFRH